LKGNHKIFQVFSKDCRWCLQTDE